MGFKNNKYVELRAGDRITLRNGDVLTYDEYYDKITNRYDSRINYTDDLTHKTRRELDVIEVKRPLEYTTVFTEEDRIEDEEVELEDVVEQIEDQLSQYELKKGNVINITIQL